MEESEQAQEAWRKECSLVWNNAPDSDDELLGFRAIESYKAALKAEIKAEMKNVPNDPENLTYPEMAAIATLKVVLSLLDTVKPR